MTKLNRVVLAEKRTDKGWHLIEVLLNDAGDLILRGHEPDEMPRAAFGTQEYEQRLEIPAEFKDTILLLLLKERFKTDGMFQQWLERHGIPYTQTETMSVK